MVLYIYIYISHHLAHPTCSATCCIAAVHCVAPFATKATCRAARGPAVRWWPWALGARPQAVTENRLPVCFVSSIYSIYNNNSNSSNNNKKNKNIILYMYIYIVLSVCFYKKFSDEQRLNGIILHHCQTHNISLFSWTSPFRRAFNSQSAMSKSFSVASKRFQLSFNVAMREAWV